MDTCQLCHGSFILFRGVQFNGMKWHSKCFQCTICTTKLSKSSAKAQDDRIYCSHCYRASASRDPFVWMSSRGASASQEPDSSVKTSSRRASASQEQNSSAWTSSRRASASQEQDPSARTSSRRASTSQEQDPSARTSSRRASASASQEQDSSARTSSTRASTSQEHDLSVRTSSTRASTSQDPFVWTSSTSSYQEETEIPRKQSSNSSRPAVANKPSSLTQKPSFTRQSSDRSTAVSTGVSVISGSICDQQVDAIVNSVGISLDLKQGALSSALLEAAGDELQTELDEVAPKFYAAVGDIYVTSGYALPCNEVIHVICSKFDDTADATIDQAFRTVIRQILEKADEIGARSLAIPPIGTGNLGYPSKLVSRTLVLETAAYLNSQSATSSLKEVRFVILPSEHVLLQEFRRALRVDRSEVRQVDSQVTEEELKRALEIQNEARKKLVSTLSRRAAVRYPKTWVSVETKQSYERCEVKPNSSEYNQVVKNIKEQDGAQYVRQILKIERVENRNLYDLYMTSKEVVERSVADGCQIERTLWHGTDVKALDSICQHGFNRAFCGKNGTLYGKGVYYARDFSYSARDTYSPPDDFLLKYIIQCRVLTGDFTAGDPDLIVAPEKAPGVLYESTVDDEDDPSIFVVFYDYRMYPEYIITFFSS